MSTNTLTDPALRKEILSDPQALLDDPEVMRALISASDGAANDNVVDLRSVAMARLEARLDRLEDTHRHVVAAAYENLAGTNMIHRAILSLLEPQRFDGFLEALRGPVADTLRVSSVRLLLESGGDRGGAELGALGDVLGLAEQGYCALYAEPGAYGAPRRVTLRQIGGGDPEVHGAQAPAIRSEACLTLDLGRGRLPGMLILGAEDPHQFGPGQGTDLLSFFAGVIERSLRRFLR
ncbi:DUF484 family protein [Palleronia sediminis]|uniref:DUF484 family protein n=1 Tax=Palleronia sediminis TaxID=2547833 RepID=A0A4R5ZYF2_9RHOB|nr:DUF484 family protein [Palleronia sediminis]TDL76230.1 DUF484 family protein [Palleronia sediminis]